MSSHDSYKKEKLEFVSNLHGTSFAEVTGFLTLFPIINFIAVMIKLLALHCSFGQLTKQQSPSTTNANLTFW
jgi:hypothetical protein